MRKILVIGSGGAGKTTFARRLAEQTGLPLIHLDALYWRARWIEPPRDEWKRVVNELVARDAVDRCLRTLPRLGEGRYDRVRM